MISRSRLAAVCIRRRFLATAGPVESVIPESEPVDPIEECMCIVFIILPSLTRLSQTPLCSRGANLAQAPWIAAHGIPS